MATVPFTTAFVRKATCPPGTAKVTLFDAEVKGFMLEVRPSSSKTYYQRYTDLRGRQRQFKIGSADILTLEQARKQARKILAEAIVGGDPQAKRAELRATPTLNEFIRDQYMPHVQGYKRSWKTDEIVIRCHIAGPLGPLPMDTVTADRISDVVRQMRAKGRASGTTNRVVILLRYIFNLAIRWKVPGVTENPTATLSLAPDVQRERFLSKGEIKRLVAAIQADENQVAANAIMLLLLTGARRNEITFAKWEYLDLEQSTLLVPVSKSGKPRKIILSELAVNLLKSITPVPRNPWIFPSPLTGRPSPSLHFPWERIKKRAGLRDVRLHDLRHSFASLLVNRGVSVYVVQKLLGHTQLRTTQRYAHLARETMLTASEVAGKVIGSVMGPKIVGEIKGQEQAG